MQETATISSDAAGRRAGRSAPVDRRTAARDRTRRFLLSTPPPARCSAMPPTRPSATPRRPSRRRGARSTPPTGRPTPNCASAASNSSTRRWSTTATSWPQLTIAEVGATPALIAGPQLDQPDRDRPLLRRPAEDLFDDRRPRQHREPRHAAPPLGGEGSRRRRRGDHRLQLSEPARAGQARARARRRLHRRAQGRAGHTAGHARAGRADRQPHRHSRRAW